MNPKIIFIRGLPGSGKSVLARAIAKRIGTENTVVLDPDAIDTSSAPYRKLVDDLRAQSVDEKFYPYRYLRASAHEAILRNATILWNQAFTSLDGLQKTMKNLSDYATENGKTLPILVVEVSVEPSTAIERIKMRVKSGGHEVDEMTFARFVQDYKSFVDEPFNTLQVSGEKSADENASLIVQYLMTLA